MNTEYYKDHKIEILQDDCPFESPRDWDNLGTMVCWHNRYNLGDKHETATSQQMLVALVESVLEPYHDTVYGWYTHELWDYAYYNNIPDDALEKLNELLLKHFIVLPLYLYDHGNITMNTSGFSCPWDSGQVGYIYVSKDQVRKKYGWKYLTQKRIKLIEKYLTSEVETYDQYLTGDIWGYKISKEISEGEYEEIDSCWGFYGYDYCLEECKSMVDYDVKEDN